MVQQTTEGVCVSVESFYQPKQSNPFSLEFLFAYRITIENFSPVPVKLLTRHWYIRDSNGVHREVEGEGVVGLQPLINCSERHQYVSACNLRSEIGKMWGFYMMEDMFHKRRFKVQIPEFQLIAPFKMN